MCGDLVPYSDMYWTGQGRLTTLSRNCSVCSNETLASCDLWGVCVQPIYETWHLTWDNVQARSFHVKDCDRTSSISNERFKDSLAWTWSQKALWMAFVDGAVGADGYNTGLAVVVDASSSPRRKCSSLALSTKCLLAPETCTMKFVSTLQLGGWHKPRNLSRWYRALRSWLL